MCERSRDYFRYRLDLSYLGTNSCGWQSQVSNNSIQDKIEAVLRVILGESVRVVGASRTDTGVSAEHQVAIFDFHRELDTFKLRKSLNALLDKSIGVLSCALVDKNFHPIRESKSKLYRYRFWLGAAISPFFRDLVWILPENLDVISMQSACKSFKGRHDFTSFCASDSSAKTREREIYDIWVDDSKLPLVELYVHGNGFLKQMVRSIAGTIVDCGKARKKPEDISAIIKAKDRKLAGMTAPAQALSLVQIFYVAKDSEQLQREVRQNCVSFWLPQANQSSNTTSN